MSNRAKVKGTFAEVCVQDYLRDRDHLRFAFGAGHAWKRVGMRGSKDEGDIHGPHTAIEVKNHATVKENDILNNAEGKGRAAGTRYWFLVYKAQGRGSQRVGEWHGLTTVGHLLDAAGWGIVPSMMTAETFLGTLPDLCKVGTTVEAGFTAPAYGEEFPEHPWGVDLLCAGFQKQRHEKRNALLDDHARSALLTTQRRVPFVISPRSEPGADGKMHLRPTSDWFAYAKFSDFANALEGVGVLPQDEKSVHDDVNLLVAAP